MIWCNNLISTSNKLKCKKRVLLIYDSSYVYTFDFQFYTENFTDKFNDIIILSTTEISCFSFWLERLVSCGRFYCGNDYLLNCDIFFAVFKGQYYNHHISLQLPLKSEHITIISIFDSVTKIYSVKIEGESKASFILVYCDIPSHCTLWIRVSFAPFDLKASEPE